jgi:hypothetical protein
MLVSDIFFSLMQIMHIRHGKYKKRLYGMRAANKMRITFLLFCATIWLFISVACDSRNTAEPIELPATTALVLQTNWAVITSSHLRLREGPGISAGVLATLWQGSVLEIVSKTSTKEVAEGEEGFWYQISFDGLAGWVFGTYLELFDSKNDAEESSRELRR